MKTKNKEIISSNILIAEFMGGEPVNKVKDNPIAYSFPFEFGHKESWDEGGFVGSGKSSCWDIEELQYHLSWDWLMPVVEKCYTNKENDKMDELTDKFDFWKIDLMYNAVVEYIKWYNNENNK